MADCLVVQTEVASEIANTLTAELCRRRRNSRWRARHPAPISLSPARFNWNKSVVKGSRPPAGYDESIALDPNAAKRIQAGRARLRSVITIASSHAKRSRSLARTHDGRSASTPATPKPIW